MSRYSRRFWAILPPSLLAVFVHSYVVAWHPPAYTGLDDTARWSGGDFTCQPQRDYDIALERDNLTVYVDTDGTMNADAGGGYTYLTGTVAQVKSVANGYANGSGDDGPTGNGSCVTSSDPTDPTANSSAGCDAVRMGVGFFGDNSDVDENALSGDPLPLPLAYRPVAAGEDKRNPIHAALDAELAGTVGFPGIETLVVPADGPGQTDTITCPAMGSLQSNRITCPPNGTPRTMRVTCPQDGVKQVDILELPVNAQAQIQYVRPNPLLPIGAYGFEIDGSSSYTAAYVALFVSPSYADVIGGLLPDITGSWPVNGANGGTFIALTAKTPGVPFAVTSVTNMIANPPIKPNVIGLPLEPPPGTTYELKINGGGAIKYTQSGTNDWSNIANGLKSEIDGASKPVDVTIDPGPPMKVVITAKVAGTGFTMNTGDVKPHRPGDTYGMIHTKPTANMNGLPGSAGGGAHTFRVRYTDAGGSNYNLDYNSDSTPSASEVCAGIAAQIDARPELVATQFGDLYIEVRAATIGEYFNLTDNGDSTLGFDVPAIYTVNGSAGLPGTPGPNHNYTVRVDGTDYTYPSDATPTQTEVCNGLAGVLNAVPGINATALPALTPTYIQVQSTYVGDPYTISESDSSFSFNTIVNGSAGLPGTPGPSYPFRLDLDPIYPAGTHSLVYPSVGLQTTETVCAGLAAAINIDGVAQATLNAAQNIITLTSPIGKQGSRWTVSNLDPTTLAYNPGPAQPNLPFNPGPGYNYTVDINGTTISFTDDGSPTRAEVCAGVAARINTTPPVNAAVGAVCTSPLTGLITITGKNPAAFDITNIDSKLQPHTIVREAGTGPSVYGDLAQTIKEDLGISTREQHAVVISHRPPQTKVDVDKAILELCEARDRSPDPVQTHFIGLDVSFDDLQIMSILAAAGGTGSCDGGAVDPCNPLYSASMVTAAVVRTHWCTGAVNTNIDGLDDRIRAIGDNLSCTFDLDVPPSYAGGQAPNNPNAVFVEIREWAGHNNTGNPDVLPDSWPWYYFPYYLDNHHNWNSGDANSMNDEGWKFAPGDRSKITFTGDLCDEFRTGKVRKLRTHVACLCSQQGQECTATPGSLTCKSIIAGQPDGLCTAEQLANMRCTKGVYICTDAGDQICSADGDNKMPEICNGIDDNCDGIVDNMSGSDVAEFAGEDPQGRNCNYKDVCVCPMAHKDTPTISTDVSDHLDTWTGMCVCGEGVEPNYSQGEAWSDEGDAFADSDAACSVGMNGPSSAFAVLTLLGMLGVARRRRRQ